MIQPPSPSTFSPRPVDEASLVSWEAIDKLIDEQKIQAALEKVDDRLQVAIANRRSDEWARALVRVTQLRIGLHGYETSVRTLMETPWPPEPLHDAIVTLFYAQAIRGYAAAYGWQIQQRERVETRCAADVLRSAGAPVQPAPESRRSSRCARRWPAPARCSRRGRPAGRARSRCTGLRRRCACVSPRRRSHRWGRP